MNIVLKIIAIFEWKLRKLLDNVCKNRMKNNVAFWIESDPIVGLVFFHVDIIAFY